MKKQKYDSRPLFFILACALLGCDDGGERTLSVSQADYWPAPIHDHMFPEPRSIAIGPNDEVLTLDRMARLVTFDASGAVKHIWRMPENANGNPQDACVLADGRIAVADTHYNRILFFNPQGEVVGQFGESGDQPGQFIFPVSIVQNDQGHLYVGEYGGKQRVQKFTAQGDFIQQFAGAGTEPGQFQRLAGMAWRRGDDGVGRLFIADAENGRVQIFTDQGEFDGLFGQSSQTQTFTDKPYHHFDMPWDVDVDQAGNVYVVEWGAGRISKFALNGRLIGRYGQRGPGEDQFRTPWAIGVDSQGRIRVADTGNRRIVALTLQ